MKFKWAQATLEYVLVIGVVAAAIIAILIFVSRGFQGNLRVQADQMGEQYAPGGMNTDITQNSIVTLNDTITFNETTKDETSNSMTTVNMDNIGIENVVRPLREELR